MSPDISPELASTAFSLLPPLLAIVLALAIRQVIPALFAGLWLGAWIVNDLTFEGLFTGFLETFQVYILDALADEEHAGIMLFTFMIGGTVGIISGNGGMQGIVNIIVQWAVDARRASLATAGMGLAIFFDDYANTLVVGNTMRPVTDSMNVSRAKLAYIVDSTAAPVACIALVTTWIGYEVGLIGDAISYLPGFEGEAYLVFLQSIPYSFYPILAIAFVFMVSLFGRDFGPMLKAEQNARAGQKNQVEVADESSSGLAHDCESIDPIEGKPQRALNAVIPIAVLVLGVVVGLYVTGRAGTEVENPGIQDIIGAASSVKALMWASLVAAMTAGLLSLGQRIMTLEEVVNAWYQGMRAMVYAMIILILAWSLGEVTDQLKTADFLVSVLGDTLPVQWVPALVFALSALTAFATGSSWGAMGILTPLVIPLTWAVMRVNGFDSPEDMHVLYSSIACVLAGSVWGDHCSPISDTTILSSLASGCNHIEHVRTQLPYAFLVGGVSVLLCTLPVAYGLPWWAGLAIALLCLLAVLHILGSKVSPEE